MTKAEQTEMLERLAHFEAFRAHKNAYAKAWARKKRDEVRGTPPRPWRATAHLEKSEA
jgi:hypothetical protein